MSTRAISYPYFPLIRRNMLFVTVRSC